MGNGMVMFYSENLPTDSFETRSDNWAFYKPLPGQPGYVPFALGATCVNSQTSGSYALGAVMLGTDSATEDDAQRNVRRLCFFGFRWLQFFDRTTEIVSPVISIVYDVKNGDRIPQNDTSEGRESVPQILVTATYCRHVANGSLCPVCDSGP